MNDFTAKLFCSQVDAETAKQEVKLNLRCKFIVGNYTAWPPYMQTGWRNMPFSLCCQPLMNRDKMLLQTEGDKNRTVMPGNAFFVPEGVSHNVSYLSGREIESVWIHFRLTLFNSFSVFDFFDVPYVFSGKRAAAIGEHLETLVNIPRELDLAGSLELELTGMALARELLTDAKLKPERVGRFRYLHRFRPVFDRLDRIEPGKAFPSSSELAQIAGVSPSRFLAVFREMTGESPTKFIERKRYLRACELLLTGSQSVAEIADELCYSDASHFSRKFKQMAGVSPKVFRLACRNGENLR